MKEIVPMIAITKPSSRDKRRPIWQAGFLDMMPDIVRHARHAFRYLDAEMQNEAVQEVIVNAMQAYMRLFQRGKVDLAYPSVLARFGVAQYHDGRRVGTKRNCRDVMSPYAGRKQGFQVESLHGDTPEGYPWLDLLVEGKHAGPAETATARIDFAAWLSSLTRRDQRIAETLSEGYTTQDVAKLYRVSAGRISQKRRELLESWQVFQGEVEDDVTVAHTVAGRSDPGH